MSRRHVTEEEVKEAKNVLWRQYRQWVDDEVLGLADEIFAGEINDGDELRERMESNTDGGLIYTHDQHMVIFVSESVSDGESRLEDMGGGGDNHLGVLALLTYQVDVEEAMSRVGMDMGDFDPIVWIKEVAKGQHDDELAVAWDKYLSRGGKPPEGFDEEEDEDEE